MAKNKISGLGRGLDAIFLDSEASESGNSTMMIRMSDIYPRPDQPRKQFDSEALAALADSIAENGILQPLLLRSVDDGFYQIIAGERRWRAAKMAGLTEVPAVITEADDKKAFEFALIENIQRENLNAIEEASAIRELMVEYGLTQEEVARRVSRSRSAVSNSIRLLDLPDNVMKMVADDEISSGHARTLLGLKNKDDIKRAADIVVKRGLSVRATEELVKNMNAEFAEEKIVRNNSQDIKVDYISQLESRITEKLGRNVKIISTGKKKRIEIEYSDNEDFETVIKHICGNDFFDMSGEPEKSGNLK